MHERQAVVFGLLIAALAVVGLGALAVYTGAIDAPFDRPLSSPEAVDDLADVMSQTQIHFGVTGLAQAYTLAAHYDNPGLVLDTREAPTVDLYVGTDFEDVVDPELVGLSSDVPLESRAGCVAIEEITPQPLPVPPAEG